MSINFDQLKELRDKTSTKGSYVFFSFSIYALIFTSLGLLEIENIVDPVDLIYEYATFLSLLSFSSLILYYLKIEHFLLKLWLRIKSFLLDYPKFRNVQFHDTVNHIYVSNNKNNFISKEISTIAFFIFSLIFWNLELVIIFIIYSILSFLLALISSLIFMKKSINIWLLVFGTELLIISIISSLTYHNFIIPLLIIPTLLLMVSLTYDWKTLEKRVKLVYFMTLFIQSRGLIKKEESVKEFGVFVEKNLWDEAFFSFNYILEYYLGSILEKKSHYLESINFIRKFKKVLDIININDPIDTQITQFYNLIDESDFELTRTKERKIYGLLQKIYSSFEHLLNFLRKLNEWDDWLIYYTFNIFDNNSILICTQEIEGNKIQLMNHFKIAQSKIQELIEIKRKDKIDEFWGSFKQAFKNLKSDQTLMDFLNVIVDNTDIDINILNLSTYDYLILKTEEKYIFLKNEFKIKSGGNKRRIFEIIEIIKKKHLKR